MDKMIRLSDINEENYLRVCDLELTAEQTAFVAAPMRILASAYAMRKQNARVWAIMHAETMVGIIMVKELFDDPACYTIEQFLIDYRHQNKGVGKTALQLVLDILSDERTHEIIEICVKMADANAIKLYKNIGFVDTGYIDPANSDSYCLRYTFA